MNFPDAYARFKTIGDTIRPGLSATAVVQAQGQLISLLQELPFTPELSPIREAIRALAPLLQGELVQQTLDELKRRTATLSGAAALLTQVANEADADARTLRFEKPQLIASGLNSCFITVQQLQAAVQAGDVAAVGDKAQALVVLLARLQSTITPGQA